MKKFMIFLLTAFIVVIFSACGTNEETSKEETNSGDNHAESTNHDEMDLEAIQPSEPEEDTVCAMCNMKVYTKEHEMGVFSAQGIAQSGDRLFFDDIGCILNYDKKHNEELAKRWVRDYDTLNWTEIENAILVKTDLKSPMKWGYVFFGSEEKAQKFIEENNNLNPSLANWDELENEAYERLKKKMEAEQKQKEHEEHDHNHNH